MSYTASGISTLGIELGYGSYTDTTTLPTSLTALGRINSIGGIQLSTENIDSSSLVDQVTQYIQGRQDTGGEWTITINLTDETLAEWTAIAGQKKFFEIYHPDMSNALWVVATVPEKLGMPELAQNELLTYEISLTLNFYYGWSSTTVALDSEA